MKRAILSVSVAAALFAGAASPAAAAVNCGLINKDLDRGRAPEVVAENMGITVAQVKDCKAKGVHATTDAPAANAPAPVKPDTGAKGAESPAAGQPQ